MVKKYFSAKGHLALPYPDNVNYQPTADDIEMLHYISSKGLGNWLSDSSNKNKGIMIKNFKKFILI